MRRGETIAECRARHREQAGEKAYKRFADAMAEFRAAIAEIAEQSKPIVTVQLGADGNEARAKMHQKVITKLRANGYRPLSELAEEKA